MNAAALKQAGRALAQKALQWLRSLPDWAWGIPPLLAVVLVGVTNRLYVDIDNYLISLVLNGLYGEGWYQLIHPWMNMALRALSRAWPLADWFALSMRIAVAAAMFWCGVLLAKAVPFGAKRGLIYGVFLLFLLREELFNKNFTICTALLAAVAVLTLALGLRRPMGPAAAWVAAGLASFACMLRSDSFLLLVPFWALDLAVWLLFCRRDALRQTLTRALRQLAPTLLCLAVLAGTQAWYSACTPFGEAQAYNDARVALVDFSIKSWEEAEAELTAAGLTQTDYEALRSAYFADSEVFPPEQLERVAQAVKTSFSPALLRNLPRVAQEARIAWNDSSALRRVAVLAVLCTLCALWAARSRAAVLELLCAWGGAGLIVLYFGLLGRVRDRVILGVLLGVLVLALLLLAFAPPRGTRRTAWVRRAGCAALGLGCLWALAHCNFGYLQLAANACSERDDLPAAPSQALYVWNPMLLDLDMTERYMERGKLPPRAYLRTNLHYGEWTVGQPYFNETLAEVGAPNLLRAVAQRPDTYFVSLRTEPLQSYLQQHYAPGAQFVQVDTFDVFAIGEVPVWQLQP